MSKQLKRLYYRISDLSDITVCFFLGQSCACTLHIFFFAFHLHFFSQPAKIAKIEVPKIEATNFVCGAYGPEGNRKVAIFGGNQYMNGLPNGPFEKTLILDWNSKTLDVNGPSLKAANPNEHEEQTIAFGDTFMFYKYRYTETKIFQFDPNGKETKIPFVGSIPGRCSDLAVVPINVIGCT